MKNIIFFYLLFALCLLFSVYNFYSLSVNPTTSQTIKCEGYDLSDSTTAVALLSFAEDLQVIIIKLLCEDFTFASLFELFFDTETNHFLLQFNHYYENK